MKLHLKKKERKEKTTIKKHYSFQSVWQGGWDCVDCLPLTEHPLSTESEVSLSKPYVCCPVEEEYNLNVEEAITCLPGTYMNQMSSWI